MLSFGDVANGIIELMIEGVPRSLRHQGDPWDKRDGRSWRVAAVR